jgi:polyhydroxybutyrate depolymerase
MRFAPLSEELGFLYAHPDGTVNPGGARFWNATDACCDFYGSGVDDSGYLLDLVQAIQGELSVDPRRIHFIGHSNGGFMSYRMACDHAETTAAIASLAGATWHDPAACSPAAPVHVLQIHGDQDTVILYEGGRIDGISYPGAIETVEQWASFDGCNLEPETDLPPLDLDSSIPGAETTVRRYADLCEPGGSSELWSIIGGSHVPILSPGFSRLVAEHLLAHPKSDPADTPESAPPEGPPSLLAWPVPSANGCWIELQRTAEGEEPPDLRIEVVDPSGRRVATLAVGSGRGETSAAVFWDGRREDGSSAPPGVYFATLAGAVHPVSTKLVVLP